MRITKEQEAILKSLKCERLSSNAENEKLIQSFNSKRGKSLVSYFKEYGMKEDKANTTAYYVIKTKEDEVLMFFSLKCGALFEPLQDEDEIKQDFQRLLILLQAIENVNRNDDISEEMDAILTKYQVGDRLSADEFIALLDKKAYGKKNFLYKLFNDKEIEDNDKILRVQNTHSGGTFLYE